MLNRLCLYITRLFQGSFEPLEIEEQLPCASDDEQQLVVFLSSTFFKFLSPTHYSLHIFSHVTSIRLRLLSAHPSQINVTMQTARNMCFHLQSCWRDDARRLRSSVHRRNSHGAVTQPWRIPTNHRIHVHPNVHRCETLNQLVCIYIHFPAHSHCSACILKILMTMTRNLFCSTPCDVLVTVVFYAQKLSLKMRLLAWVGTTHIKVGEEKMEPTVTQEWMNLPSNNQIRWRRKLL